MHRKCAAVWCALAAVLTLAAAGVVCVVGAPAPPCSWEGMNFPALVGAQVAVDVTGTTGAGPSGAILHAAICGAVTSTNACVKEDEFSSVCLVTAEQQAISFGAYDSSSTWGGGMQPGDAAISMRSSQICNGDASDGVYTSNLELMCQRVTSFGATQTSPCHFSLFYATPLACQPPLAPSVSCQWSPPSGGPVYDFRALQSGGDLTYIAPTGDEYRLHVCDTVSTKRCADVNIFNGACRENTDGTLAVLGSWENYEWGFVNPAVPAVGVQVSLRGGLLCTAPDGTQAWNWSVIRFLCAEQEGALAVTYDEASCTYIWTLSTPLGCAAQAATIAEA